MPQPPDGKFTHPVVLVGCLCAAEVAGMLGVFAFPALLPHFMQIWELSGNQAGWINGIYFIGYTGAVPVLTSLTDRMDARRIYLAGCVIGIISNFGFAFLAGGFWTALLFRALCGISLAGTFIPGLKALMDRVAPSAQPRSIAFYTACFGLGMSASFFVAGHVFEIWGWETAFAAAAAGSGLALVLAGIILTPVLPPDIGTAGNRHILDFRPVWQNRNARAYILAYMCHTWEMFAARAWLVAFMAFNLSLHPGSESYLIPTTVMAVAGIAGMLASIAGAELAVRFPRKTMVILIMGVSGLISVTIGFWAGLDPAWVAMLCIVYTIFFQGDSAAIHAGVITSARPDLRGATMALQSLGGFGAAALGTIAAGWVLDFSGGGLTIFSWGVTFASMGVASVTGVILVARIAD
ncbi:MAG: MFS transporter [Desulfotignum sp.]|nr:MFS transporter [Desulfotignum sp.]MCF8139099.1 MFS transporter [Desulfotignum sp.]